MASSAENDQKQAASGVPPTHCELPIDRHRSNILAHIHSHQVTCIKGETGSGKSTRVPQFLVEEYKKAVLSGIPTKKPNIVITQPRRIAAKSLAKRVASEFGENLGDTVGYKIGQEQNVSSSTQICYVTTGYMIELLVHNPKSFSEYTHVILDEIHERELDADLLSLIVHKLIGDESYTKLVIMSATLQAKLFLRYFGDLECLSDAVSSQVLSVGVESPYQVETKYLEDMMELFTQSEAKLPAATSELLLSTFCQFSQLKPRDLLKMPSARERSDLDRKAFKKMLELAKSMKSDIDNVKAPKASKTGDKQAVWSVDKYMMLGVYLTQAVAKPGASILIFLPGVREIDEMYDLLYPYEKHKDKNWLCQILVFCLHSKIPFDDQQECFREPDPDKCHVILATNIAESSITLPKISVIIDFAQRRNVVYDARRRLSLLTLNWCSQASMDQRKGRTGRVCDGLCLRVLPQEFFKKLEEFDAAQMKQAPLDKLFLQVKFVAQKIAPDESPSELLCGAVEPPDPESVSGAIQNLANIGALLDEDELSDVTVLGKLAMNLPLDLNLCRLVMFGVLLNQPCDAILMAAALQAQDPFRQPSNRFMKDMYYFISAQRLSFDSRCKFDAGHYSEPIMIRNLLIAWFKVLEDEAKMMMKGKEKSGVDIKRCRSVFGAQHQVDARRLRLLEGIVADVAEKMQRWVPKGSEAKLNIESLIKVVPHRRQQSLSLTASAQWMTQADQLESIQDLFTEDTLLLHTILTASLVPKFLFGKVPDALGASPNYRGKKQTLGLEENMARMDLDPSRSVCIENPPPLSGSDLKDLIQCISLDRNHADDRKNYKTSVMQPKKLYIEFKSEKEVEEQPEEMQVTRDVARRIHYVFQFSKETYYEPNLYESGSVLRREEQASFYKITIPSQPYRIQWQLMSSDGTALKQSSSSVCKAFCYWRNPVGFMCDVQKNYHLGLASSVTAGLDGKACWVDGFSALPLYKQNLFALLLMLTFIPHQQKVLFEIHTGAMAILKVNLYNYDIPIPAKHPLTERLLQIVNEIREEVSNVFCSTDSQNQRLEMPLTTLPDLYNVLMQELNVVSELTTQNSTNLSRGRRLPRKVEVNGFSDYTDTDVYLMQYNTDLLFNKECLYEYHLHKPMH